MEDKQGTIHLREDYNIKAIRVYWTKSQEEKENRNFFDDRNRWIWNGWLHRVNNCAIIFRTFPIGDAYTGKQKKKKSLDTGLLHEVTEEIVSGERLDECEDKLYWRAYEIATNILIGKNGRSLRFYCELPKVEFTSVIDHIKRRRIRLERETVDKLVESQYGSYR
jgi:hypothetical protein